MSETKKKKHNHVDHRKRLKDEFLQRGLQGMPEHKILEIMLFYSIPLKDTNDIAHDLINHFGSLHKVLNASFDDLCEVNGIKEHTATMFCLFRELSMLYLSEKFANDMAIEDSKSLFTYCRTLFINADTEEMHCIYLDDELRLMGTEKLFEGTMGSVDLSLRTLAESVVKSKCNHLVITHNHPNGNCVPSKDDLNTTIEIWKLLNAIEIDLIDHVIVGKNGEFSMRNSNTLPQIWRG